MPSRLLVVWGVVGRRVSSINCVLGCGCSGAYVRPVWCISKSKAAKSAKPKRFRGPRTTLHGEVLERDKVRDNVDEMLSGMRQDFIFARLVPACALCHKYFMGHTDDDKVSNWGRAEAMPAALPHDACLCLGMAVA